MSSLCLHWRSLFSPGYFYDAHDGRHSVFYLIQFDASIRDGAWWPRWAMHHIQGYGYPTFLIQAPLGLYLGEFFVLLGAGFTTAAKLSWAVGMFAGVWGMYALVRHWLSSPLSGGSGTSVRAQHDDLPLSAAADIGVPDDRRWVPLAALAAGVLYAYFPYHVVDMYVRGALNDTLLLSWLPWLFLVFDRLLVLGTTCGWQRRLGLSILVLGGTLLTHTFALLSIVPLLVSLVIFRLVQAWRQVGRPLAAHRAGFGGWAGWTAALLYLYRPAAGRRPLLAAAGVRHRYL